MSAGDTLLSCLTPPGKAAIAVVAVRGPQAWTVTRALFRRFTSRKKAASATAPLPDAPAIGQSWLGLLGEAAGDEAVLLVRELSPAVSLELHCHGGIEIVRHIEEQFRARGVQIVDWRAFQSDGAPAWRVQAQQILAEAPTLRTAAIALDQWHGAFARRVGECSAAWERGAHERARDVLRRLRDLEPVGGHLARPWRVVVSGAPNVGKSSLINALAGFTRCLVAPTPGTTRDVVTTTIALDGWPIELSDTAGLRDGAEPLEQAGIGKAKAALAEADLAIWVLDGSTPAAFPDAERPWLRVINKTDLAAAWDWSVVPEAVRGSALTKAGLSDLSDAIVRRLVPDPPAPGEAVPISDDDRAALDAMQARFAL
jgi:tRNA modification GTPase